MTSTACAAWRARADLRADEQRARDVQRPLAVDELAELDAVEVLHHEEERAVGGGARVGDVDDVGVADLRGGARLAPEALDQIGRLAVGRVQDLERDAPADVDVLGLVDPPHAALAEEAPDVVAAADQRPDDRRRGVRSEFESADSSRRIALAVSRRSSCCDGSWSGDGQPLVAQPPGLDGHREHRLALRALGLVVGARCRRRESAPRRWCRWPGSSPVTGSGGGTAVLLV